jgi:heme-degrading monooxygenase HmoA
MSESRTEAVFVNVIDVEPSRYQELMTILNEGNDTVIRRREGFISAVLLANGDKSRVVTVARWQSMDAIKALQSDTVVATYVNRTAAIAKANPAVFAVVAEYWPARTSWELSG